MAAITEREAQQVERANASGKTPVVFIHGLWLLPSSWDNWAALFEEAGYAPVTPGWPDDPETVEQARANPKLFANKTLGQIADHTRRGDRKVDEEAGGDGATRPAGCWPRSSPVAVYPRPRWRSIPAPSAACWRCLSPR